VLGDLAYDAGLTSVAEDDLAVGADELANGKSASQWVVMVRAPADLGPLASDARWKPLPLRPGTAVWTDNFSSILSVFRRQ
jgi:hypothetical protein